MLKTLNSDFLDGEDTLKSRSKGVVRNYQRGRAANKWGRVMSFCALKKGGLQFFQLSLKGGS